MRGQIVVLSLKLFFLCILLNFIGWFWERCYPWKSMANLETGENSQPSSFYCHRGCGFQGSKQYYVSWFSFTHQTIYLQKTSKNIVNHEISIKSQSFTNSSLLLTIFRPFFLVISRQITFFCAPKSCTAGIWSGSRGIWEKNWQMKSYGAWSMMLGALDLGQWEIYRSNFWLFNVDSYG